MSSSLYSDFAVTAVPQWLKIQVQGMCQLTRLRGTDALHLKINKLANTGRVLFGPGPAMVVSF
jgi:hypothetical protein